MGGGGRFKARASVVATAFAMAFNVPNSVCEICNEKMPKTAKPTQLCPSHETDRAALLLQASKAAHVPAQGSTGKISLKEYFEKMEAEDHATFIAHLTDFCKKILGLMI